MAPARGWREAAAASLGAWDRRARERRRQFPRWRRVLGRGAIFSLIVFTVLLLADTAFMQGEADRQHRVSQVFLAELAGTAADAVPLARAGLVRRCLMILHENGGLLGRIAAANERVAVSLGIIENLGTGVLVRASCLRVAAPRGMTT